MPSPFPGMDPFIESQEWKDFHAHLIAEMAGKLNPQLKGQYVARIGRRVYIDYDPLPEQTTPRRRTIEPDVAVTRDVFAGGGGVAVATEASQAITVEIPEPEEQNETFLVLRRPGSDEVITVVEVLSPTNKRPAGDGRGEYLRKRNEVLRSRANLVEIDLLRCGERMPMRVRTADAAEVAAADAVVLVSRSRRRSPADLFPCRLPGRLPVIPIPLSGDDPDVTLDLQVLLTTIYDRSRYDVTLDYTAPLDPPADEATAAWIADVTGAAKPPGG